MGWKTLDEIAKAGPMRTSLERRVEDDRVAHYLDASTGRRMVWLGASEAPPPRELGELRETVAELRALIGDLRSTRAVAPKRAATGAVSGRTIPRRRAAPPIRPRPARQAPILKAPIAQTPTRKAPAAISEAEIARIMEARARCPLGDKALQRAAGLASNWFWKVKRGQCRSVLAVVGWSRLEDFLGSQPQSARRAA
jgi:hypothetical protein